MPTEISIRETARARIGHIVVLMLENRAFDHTFGLLEHPTQAKLEEGEFENALNPDDPASRCYGVTSGASYSLPVDPPHCPGYETRHDDCPIHGDVPVFFHSGNAAVAGWPEPFPVGNYSASIEVTYSFDPEGQTFKGDPSS